MKADDKTRIMMRIAAEHVDMPEKPKWPFLIIAALWILSFLCGFIVSMLL